MIPPDWCECNSAPEDNHFPLHCNLFQVSRIELINSITFIVSPYNLIDEINNHDPFSVWSPKYQI